MITRSKAGRFTHRPDQQVGVEQEFHDSPLADETGPWPSKRAAISPAAIRSKSSGTEH